ncbi:MAG: hypothetical protein LBF41_04500 [Deltaproteobacteria bacterium]|jgi:flagellar motility protein MotE (MotC chaperone)|nr:hypothetical protein [Deltaproteobacteria bacterium]
MAIETGYGKTSPSSPEKGKNAARNPEAVKNPKEGPKEGKSRNSRLPVKKEEAPGRSPIFSRLRLVILLALLVLIARLSVSGFFYLRRESPLPDMTPPLEASSLAAGSLGIAEGAAAAAAEAGMAAAPVLAGSPMLSGASIFFEAATPAVTAAAQQSSAIPLPPNAEGLRQPQRPAGPPPTTDGTSEAQTGSSGGAPLPPVPRSPSGATSEELDRREFELNRREVQLNTREEALRDLERDLDARTRKAELAEQEINELILRNDAILGEQKNQREEQRKADDALKSARVEHLVSAFKSMKPEQAAMLINSMEDGVAVALLSAMPGRNAGLILGMVSPDKAARLVKAISEQRIDPRVLLENAELDAQAGGGGT